MRSGSGVGGSSALYTPLCSRPPRLGPVRVPSSHTCPSLHCISAQLPTSSPLTHLGTHLWVSRTFQLGTPVGWVGVRALGTPSSHPPRQPTPARWLGGGLEGVPGARTRTHPAGVSNRGAGTPARRIGVGALGVDLGAANEQHDSAEFDVGLAIALAGCAFEAYNDPTGVPDALRDVARNGTMVTFIESDLLKGMIAGLLRINLKGAKGLAAKDVWGTSDPYCILSVGPSSYTSAVKDRDLDPQWDETCTLFVRDLGKDRLTIRVNDKDMVGSDDGIGIAVIPLQTLTDGKERELDIALEGTGTPGSVQLTVRFDALSDSMADDIGGEMSAVPAPETLSKMAEAWRNLAELSGRRSTFDPICFVENEETDTQAWIGCSAPSRSIVVAFRGTEQVKWKDFLTDLNVVPTSFNVERAMEGGGLGSLFFKAQKKVAEKARDPEFLAGPSGGNPLEQVMGMIGSFRDVAAAPVEVVQEQEPWVHQGFISAYDSVKARIFALVDDIMASDSSGPWTIYVTGHSLGGALSTLAAYELAVRSPRGLKPQITMYNYGSPRVGNKIFAEAYDEAVPNTWRVINTKDVIPRVPRLMGYCHVGRCIALKEDGTFEIDGTDEVFQEGTVVEEIMPLLAGEAIAAAKSGNLQAGELKALIDYEMEFFNTIMDGSAILQHFEDYYLTSLCSALTGNADAVLEATVKVAEDAAEASKDLQQV